MIMNEDIVDTKVTLIIMRYMNPIMELYN